MLESFCTDFWDHSQTSAVYPSSYLDGEEVKLGSASSTSWVVIIPLLAPWHWHLIELCMLWRSLVSSVLLPELLREEKRWEVKLALEKVGSTHIDTDAHCRKCNFCYNVDRISVWYQLFVFMFTVSTKLQSVSGCHFLSDRRMHFCIGVRATMNIRLLVTEKQGWLLTFLTPRSHIAFIETVFCRGLWINGCTLCEES